MSTARRYPELADFEALGTTLFHETRVAGRQPMNVLRLTELCLVICDEPAPAEDTARRCVELKSALLLINCRELSELRALVENGAQQVHALMWRALTTLLLQERQQQQQQSFDWGGNARLLRLVEDGRDVMQWSLLQCRAMVRALSLQFNELAVHELFSDGFLRSFDALNCRLLLLLHERDSDEVEEPLCDPVLQECSGALMDWHAVIVALSDFLRQCNGCPLADLPRFSRLARTDAALQCERRLVQMAERVAQSRYPEFSGAPPALVNVLQEHSIRPGDVSHYLRQRNRGGSGSCEITARWCYQSVHPMEAVQWWFSVDRNAPVASQLQSPDVYLSRRLRNLLALYLFNTHCATVCAEQFSWIFEAVCTEFQYSHDALRRRRYCPVRVVLACGGCFVHSTRPPHVVLCDTVYEAIVCWLWLVRRDFAGTVATGNFESEVDVSELCDDFLPWPPEED